MTAPTEHRRDRQVSLIQWLTAGTTILALLLLVVAVPLIVDSSAGIDAQRSSDEVTACRSEYRARIDVANLAADDVESRRIDLIAAVVTSAVQGEDPGTAEAASRLAALAPSVAAARDDVKRTTSQYQRAVSLSRTDPERFLRACGRLTGQASTVLAPAAPPAVPVPGIYESCTAARQAGAAPLRDGDPGWNPGLDRDGDGVACE